MTEFSRGIFKVIASTSAGRALVYTIGHVCIAMTVVSVLTGASLFEAGLVAVSYTHLTLPTSHCV